MKSKNKDTIGRGVPDPEFCLLVHLNSGIILVIYSAHEILV